MPEYLAPGVRIDELSAGATPIEGVATSTAAFVGATRTRPPDGDALVTSLVEFEREYGDASPLSFSDGTQQTNWMWHGARAFFANGGHQLVVAPAGGVGDAPLDEAAYRSALARIESVAGISIVAAPGATAGYAQGRQADVQARCAALLDHAQRLRRFAVLDAGDQQSVTDVLAMRASFDSQFGALYYPWVIVADPAGGAPFALPPSGFVAGIYARVDVSRGVQKAPANEVVQLAIDLERDVTDAEQGVLNPAGVNCLRRFPGRGIRVWGARTLASDPEWRYVNVRRLFIYLEESIVRGTRWVVFEPNGEPAWARIRQQVTNFLVTVWREGALAGAKAEEAFFVTCDRTTMTQDDIDNGRLIALVGVAAVKPSEFVVFRVEQRTLEAV